MNTIHSAHIIKALRLAALSLVVLAFSDHAFAQNTQPVEVSGGYQFLDPHEDDTEMLDQGWYAESAYNANRVVGLIGQVASNAESREAGFSNEGVVLSARATARIYTLLAGVRLSDRRSSRAIWFGEALIGNVRTSARATVTGTDRGIPIDDVRVTVTTSNLGLQFGGGVSLQLSARIGLRVSVGSLRVFTDEDSSSAIRFATGIVVPLGRR